MDKKIPMTTDSRPPACKNCEDYGFVWDCLGGCGDPECCGGPFKVRCLQCNNDWSIDDDYE